MAWEIYIQDLPDVAAVTDIPEDFMPRGIGRFDERLRQVLEVVPFAERQDADWVFVNAPDIELSISFTRDDDGEGLRSMAVHVHGGEQAPACVAAILRRLELRALDTGTGDFFDLERPERGQAMWSAFRDQVLRSGGA